jgi:hypothetical protein
MLDLPKGVSGEALHAQCIHFKKSFHSNPRVGIRQKTCGADLRRRKHRACYQRRYRRENPEVEIEIRKKIRDERGSGFWKAYRASHSKSTERNRALAMLRMKLRRGGLQRKLDILQVFDPPVYFNRYTAFATSHRSLLNELKFIPEALNTKGA